MLKKFKYIFLFVFAVIFVLEVEAPQSKESLDDERDSKQAFKLQQSKLDLSTFEFTFDRTLQKPYPSNTYGVLYRELISVNEQYNESTADPDILEELKRALLYFYANTPVNTNPLKLLVNFHVTQIARWMHLNFQTCVSFYTAKNDGQNEIVNNCKMISKFLEAFLTAASDVKARQLNMFKENSPKHIKVTEQNEKRAKRIAANLKKVIKIKNINEPDIKNCQIINDADEKTYCELWTEKLIDEPIDLKLNNNFFNVYYDLKDGDFSDYLVDDYTCSYKKSLALWKYTTDLLKLVDKREAENENSKKITSFSISMLIEIIDFKLRQFDVEPSMIETEIPEMKDFAEVEQYFAGDTA